MDVRIGVYVCHCGTNIAGKVDVEEVARYASGLPGVVVAKEYRYMCSSPGVKLIQEDIREHNLDRVVVAACSPHLHERTFRTAVMGGGLNPFLFQQANIREHVSWVTEDPAEATTKAKALVRAAVARAPYAESLDTRRVPVKPSVAIIGAGIAGIHAALAIADAGKQVYLIEKEPTIGGHMAKFDKTFPTLDCAACILTPKMGQAGGHPNIKILRCAEVTNVEGSVGDFTITVHQKPTYIVEENCIGCGECIEGCVYKEARFPDEFSMGLGKRKPVYFSFPQAVPNMPVIDPETCIYHKTGKCPSGCIEACGDRNAIDLDQKAEDLELNVGAIIATTGFQAFDPTPMTQYLYGKEPGVYTALEIEQVLNAAGPTGGQLVLRDGTPPKSVAILHCIGSRDQNTHEYCSRVCCMYSLKFAHLVKERLPDTEVYNFYIDLRAFGKGYEEFYQRVMNEGSNMIRGKAAFVTTLAESPEEEGKLVVVAEDTLLQEIRRIPADMVILATGLEARKDFNDLRRTLNISASADGFAREQHPKLAPFATTTAGVFIAGCVQGPKDIPDTIAQAGAAAAEVLALIDAGTITLEPDTAWADEDRCVGCGVCVSMCPYTAISLDTEKKVSVVNEVLCKGCGTCVAACPSGAMQQHLFSAEQIMAELEGVLQ